MKIQEQRVGNSKEKGFEGKGGRRTKKGREVCTIEKKGRDGKAKTGEKGKGQKGEGREGKGRRRQEKGQKGEGYLHSESLGLNRVQVLVRDDDNADTQPVPDALPGQPAPAAAQQLPHHAGQALHPPTHLHMLPTHLLQPHQPNRHLAAFVDAVWPKQLMCLLIAYE